MYKTIHLRQKITNLVRYSREFVITVIVITEFDCIALGSEHLIFFSCWNKIRKLHPCLLATISRTPQKIILDKKVLI
jgi:hypothetical protein